MNYSLQAVSDEPLGRERSRHLLNRALHGPRKSEIDAFSELTVSEALDTLLAEEAEPSPPLQIYGEDPDVPFGTTWVDAALNSTFRFRRKKSLRAWWTGLIIKQQATVKEKMILFWHNHFATEVDAVGIPAYMYDYHQLLNRHAMGNFKTLTEEMTINTGMLRYLDGTQNTAGSPNENYSRELFELFTIGKGQLIGEGNYTNYTEQDVQEGARVLTGWKIDNNTLSSYFNESKHDTGVKTFSGFYGDHTIQNQGQSEYLALVDMIFSKRETAKYLVRKLYRWFVYYEINEDVETNIIEPLTTTFFDSGYEISSVLRQLLASEHFFDPELRGCYIKSPVDFTLGTLRRLELEIPEDLFTQYEFHYLFHTLTSKQDFNLGTPPDVAGWPAYYLEPQFNKLWVNSATLPLKAEFISRLLLTGYYKNKEKLIADVLSLAKMTSDPSDENILVEELCSMLLPVDLETPKLDKLIEILKPEVPSASWTSYWIEYMENPGNSNARKYVENPLRELVMQILLYPEYLLM